MQRRKINQIIVLKKNHKWHTKGKTIFSHQCFVDKNYSNRCDNIKHPWSSIKHGLPISHLCWSHFLYYWICHQYFLSLHRSKFFAWISKATTLSALGNKLSQKVRIKQNQRKLFAGNKCYLVEKTKSSL